MSPAEIKSAIEAAREVAAEAAVELIKHYGNVEYEIKDLGEADAANLVTELDKQTEQLIEKRLKESHPEIGFRGEEFGAKDENELFWLVDPIDGTAHFVRGLPYCTTMIALVENGIVIGSVIHDFVHDNSYWAIRGAGAFCGDEKLSVSDRTLAESYVCYESRLATEKEKQAFMAVRDIGITMETICCGMDFVRVATGKVDGRIMDNPWAEDWDVAAGSLIVEEAGGVVKNIGSDKYDYTNHDALLTNPKVYKDLTSGEQAIFPVN